MWLEIGSGRGHVAPGRARGGMADAPDLGSGAARLGGSSPLARTISFFRNFGRFVSVSPRQWEGSRRPVNAR